MVNPFIALVVLVEGLRDRLVDDERGATAVEYGLLVALIAAVIVGAVVFLGSDLRAMFTDVLRALPGGH
ncbi:Flp family type IVb pilin [Modestobacter sp. Leaf380]|uniref:Flp family type IVb pilin n=1 Tax=Modestobacter sp. Leaf380 TaxID=1736356 RepID=UPI0006FB3840|nr:Flp family type IVb pilin [Modestobacter sp. Leaf380]KQS66292.1 hypothetical protein ASG41_13355 [Modestobacter sp. Leaf380]